MRTICNIFILVFAVVIAVFAMGFSPTVFAAEGDLIWTQTSNPSSGSDYAWDIAVDSSGIYVAGVDSFPGNGQWRIEKRDLINGNIIWTQTSNPGAWGDAVKTIAVDSTGVYVAGHDTSSGQYKWRIEKRDLSNGNIIWTQTSNQSNGDSSVWGIAVDSTGVYVAGGYFLSPSTQWIVKKLSLSDGNIIWTKAGSVRAHAITVDSAGVYVAGLDNSPGNNQWRIEKRDLINGNIIWTQTSNPGPGYDWAYAISSNNTGVYVVGFDDPLGNYNSQWRIEKRSLSTGVIMWIKTNNPSPNTDQAVDVTINNNGVYIVGLDNSPGNNQWRIEKRDPINGNIIWTKMNNQSSGYDQALGIVVDSTGIYVVGYDSFFGNEQWRIEKREIAPTICTGPFVVSWTDPAITANSTKIRKVHIDEMRTQINNRRVDAGLTNYSWTDPTITANSTKIRKVHIDEMRTAISQVYTTCGQTAPSWTDSIITANTTKIRAVHINELRTAISNAL